MVGGVGGGVERQTDEEGNALSWLACTTTMIVTLMFSLKKVSVFFDYTIRQACKYGLYIEHVILQLFSASYVGVISLTQAYIHIKLMCAIEKSGRWLPPFVLRSVRSPRRDCILTGRVLKILFPRQHFRRLSLSPLLSHASGHL